MKEVADEERANENVENHKEMLHGEIVQPETQSVFTSASQRFIQL